MVHGRMIRPAVAGAMPVKVDESSIKDIPGAKVVWDKGFLGVVADKEWDAIKAAQKLKVEWSNVEAAFPDQARSTITSARRRCATRGGGQNGQCRRSLQDRGARHRGRIRMAVPVAREHGPGLRAGRDQGRQRHLLDRLAEAHFVRDGIALTLGIPPDKVRAIWVVGPGSYGRNDADDAAMDAAVLAKAVGKPVRLQYMRDQGTGWDPKGPASIHKARAAVDAQGKVIAYEFNSKGFSRVDVNTNGGKSHDTLAGQTLGVALKSGDGFGVPAESYASAQQTVVMGNNPAAVDRSSPLRSAHLRDPVGPQIHFASEFFIDEVAAAVNADPSNFGCLSGQAQAAYNLQMR